MVCLGVAVAGLVTLSTVAAGTAGSLATLPQEHDMITHTLLTAHIAYTGQAAPWAAFPVDLLSGTPASFYP